MNGKNTRRGFSLLEMVVVMALLSVIMSGLYFMIIYFGNVSKTEHSRVRLQQEARFILSSFTSELKNAGAVISVANSDGFLSGAPSFNGVYPINNNDYPDGIIVASGDPQAVTFLIQEYPDPDSTSSKTLQVDNVDIDPDGDGDPSPWSLGDKGVLIGIDGYYVFSVVSVDFDNSTITMRSEPVYYSGLLNEGKFKDIESTKGNTVTYPKNAPVFRLSTFGIYLFEEVLDPKIKRNIRRMIRVTDTMGFGNVLTAGSGVKKGVISENIWDLQISYTAYPLFPDTSSANTNRYFAGGTSSTVFNELIDDIRNKFLKEIKITIVSLSDDYGGKGKRILTVPAIGDRTSYTLPSGKYNFKVFSMALEPKNYSIII